MDQHSERPFGDLLRHYRKVAGLTQEALAERANLSARAISDLERGANHVPRNDTLRLLIAALQLAGPERRQFESAAREAGLPPRAPVNQERRTNLPVAPNLFVGRHQEVAAIQQLLRRTQTPLVTLTGPPGIGKTRLAQQAAAGLLDAFADGVVYVPLASIADPALVGASLAQALNVRESAPRSVQRTLQEYLREKRLLLVLDNFEQVIGAGPLLAGILAAAPEVRMLVTSRERLHLAAEHDVLVPPLTLPGPDRVPQVADLAAYEGCVLFVERARAVQRSFSLTPANAAAVVAICRRLDGVPLAIELAAARIRHLPPAALLARLETRLALLTGGPQDAPNRQQTLRDAIAWSYDLLAAGERRQFRCLAVFVGGFTLAAAAEVLDRPVGSAAVLESVAALVDKSLLQAEEQPNGEPRYQMLETIREYALEQLAATDEEEHMREAHSRFFLGLAEQAAPHLRGPEQGVWLAELESEHDNLRAALLWACLGETAAQAELAGRLATALWRFWYVRGYLSEGRRWLEAALQMSARLPVELQARAHYQAGTLAVNQSAYAEARALLTTGVDLYRQIGHALGVAESLTSLAVVASNQGDYESATTWLTESLAVFRNLGTRRGIVSCLNNLGHVAMVQGDYARAEALFREGLTELAAEGSPEYRAILLNNLGQVARHQGDFLGATQLHKESLHLKRELGDKVGIASSLNSLGDVARARQDYATAQGHYAESLTLYQELGDAAGMAQVLSNLGQLARSQGDVETAARLLTASLNAFLNLGDKHDAAICLVALAALATQQDPGAGVARAAGLLSAADALLSATHTALAPNEDAEFQRLLADCRTALGVSAFGAAWAVGRTLPPAAMPAESSAIS